MTRVLTPREVEICHHVGHGLTNAEIAEVLWITRNTVRTHVSRICRVLDVHSRGALVATIWRSGMVRSRPPSEPIAVSEGRAKVILLPTAVSYSPEHGADHYDPERESLDASEPGYV